MSKPFNPVNKIEKNKNLTLKSSKAVHTKVHNKNDYAANFCTSQNTKLKFCENDLVNLTFYVSEHYIENEVCDYNMTTHHISPSLNKNEKKLYVKN